MRRDKYKASFGIDYHLEATLRGVERTAVRSRRGNSEFAKVCRSRHPWRAYFRYTKRHYPDYKEEYYPFSSDHYTDDDPEDQ